MNWYEGFSNWLISATVSGLLVSSVGGAAVALCRQPIYRIRLVQSTLIGCLLVPIFQQAAWLPSIPLRVLPVAAAAPGTVSFGVEEARSAHSPGGSVPSPAARTSAADAARPMGEGHLHPVASDDPRVNPRRHRTSQPAARAIATDVSPRIPFGVLLLFAGGSTLLLVRTGAGVVRCIALERAARPATRALQSLFISLAGRAGRRTRLLISDRVDSPITWGLWRPRIVIPASLTAVARRHELQWCLAHEWSHVRRHDIGMVWLATLAQIVCFHQPVFWWLKRQMLLDQDYLADAEAARQGASAEDYAEFLVTLAQRRGPGLAPSLGIGDRRSRLVRRVRMLVASPVPVQQHSRWMPTLSIAAASVAVWALLGTLQLSKVLVQGDEPPAKAPPPATALADQASQPSPTRDNPITYRGKVIDRVSRQPITGAIVEVRRELSRDPRTGAGRTLETTRHPSNAEGVYEFTLPPEQVAEPSLYLAVDARHPNYQPMGEAGYSHAMIRTNLAQGDPPFYATIELSPGRAVSGTVQTPNGTPLAGVPMLVYSKAPSATGQELDVDWESGAFQYTTTDEAGRFQFVVATPGQGVFWLYPLEHSVQAHLIRRERGDLGTLVVDEGMRLRGQVRNAQGRPVPSVWVNARRKGDGEQIDAFLEANYIVNQICRAAMTDAEGNFDLAPLPEGDYRIEVSERSRYPAHRENLTPKPLDDAFIPLHVRLARDVPVLPLDIRAVPHVVVRARVFRINGEPRASHAQSLIGRIGEEAYAYQARSNAPQDDGWFEFKVPRGLREARIKLTTNEHSALRWRMSHDAPLQFGRRDILLGTLESDVFGIEVIRYEAPLLLIKAVDEQGAVVADFEPDLTYAIQPDGPPRGRYTEGGDVHCVRQPDGRWRTSELLPDAQCTVAVRRDGYTSEPQTLSLPEGERQELTFVLRKSK